MFGLFNRRTSILESGLLKGAVDQHSHILYGLDDGVKTQEDSLAILQFLEEQGVSEVWFTPHVMEDVPNTTEGIRARFEELKAVYAGGLQLHLAAEYMMDTLFEDRLARRDLLEHGEEVVLVETSAIAPPINLWVVLEKMLSPPGLSSSEQAVKLNAVTAASKNIYNFFIVLCNLGVYFTFW